MKKNKIGVITFHTSDNSGSFLQSYALQNYLKSKGNVTSEVIDFANDGSRKMYKLFIENKSIKDVVKNVLYFLYFKVFYKGYFDYRNYLEKNLDISETEYKKIEELSNIEENYDCFISGSDQIWNITCKDADDAYFLPFVKNKTKIAYAPSLGAKNIFENTTDPKKYVEYLNDYKFLSVREKNGKKWLEEKIGREVSLLPDPTLLLNSYDYEKILETTHKPKRYIFYYSYDYSKQVNQVVESISKLYGIPVIVFNGKRYIDNKMFLNDVFKLPKKENPGVFLDLMKNAEMVLTTSFHGTIFSTIFRKNFWVIKSGGMNGKDDRIRTLLEQIDLEDRLLPLDTDIKNSYELINKKVDYTDIDEHLKRLQDNAYNFLKKSLEGYWDE